MKPAIDTVCHAAELARRQPSEAASGGKPEPPAPFRESPSKALDEVAAELQRGSTRD